MRNLKMMAIAVLFGVLSITNFVAPIGDSKNIKKIGVESSNIIVESRNRVTTINPTSLKRYREIN